ncbi:unnamed protein product [Gadus morhua 'NCC']
MQTVEGGLELMPNCLKCWQKRKPDVGAPHQQMPLGTSKRWSVQCQSRELCFRDAVLIVYSWVKTIPPGAPMT